MSDFYRVGRIQLVPAVFEHVSGPCTKKGGQAPRTGKGKKTDSPLEPPEKTAALRTTDFSAGDHFGLLTPRTVRS